MTGGGRPSGRSLSRAAGDGRAAAPVRIAHLGLGNFFRAHQVFYTDHAPDAADWGIAAFTGRSAELAEQLSAQDGLYTLITRAADGDRFEVLSSLSRTHAATDHEAWLGYLASPDLRAVTVTVTEAGYLRGDDGGLNRDNDQVRADVAALRADPTAIVRTAPGRLVAGCAARRRADSGPFTIVPCDNLPGNGAVATRVVRDLAELLDPGLADWIDESVSYVTSVVDRITPRTTDDDRRAVADATGVDDRSPVATEPFHEWVLSGVFPAGRPQWDKAGATFAENIDPYEDRKLWLLNGAHSLLAYAGSARGHQTVAEAVADDDCREWMQQWWTEAVRHIDLPANVLDDYRTALLDRFANPRMRHLLAQIAADGSQKLPVRILPVLRAERAAGRMPEGATRALGAWVGHLRGAGTNSGVRVDDVHAERMVSLAAGPLDDAVRRVLDSLDTALGADDDVLHAVTADAEHFVREHEPQ